MKLLIITAIVLAAIVQLATANFDIYWAGVGGNGISGSTWGFQVYEAEATCNNVLDWVWRASNDVSGGKWGVRCNDCKPVDPDRIEVMEMNFGKRHLHWTIYKDRAYFMYDLDNNVVGQCIPFPAPKFHCGLRPVGRAEGIRKMRCLTKTTADEINRSLPPRRMHHGLNGTETLGEE